MKTTDSAHKQNHAAEITNKAQDGCPDDKPASIGMIITYEKTESKDSSTKKLSVKTFPFDFITIGAFFTAIVFAIATVSGAFDPLVGIPGTALFVGSGAVTAVVSRKYRHK